RPCLPTTLHDALPISVGSRLNSRRNSMLRIRTAKPMARMNRLWTSELSSDLRYWNRKPTGSSHSRASLSCGGLPEREHSEDLPEDRKSTSELQSPCKI